MNLNHLDFDSSELIEAIGQLSGLTLQIHQEFKPIYVSEDCARLYGFNNSDDFIRYGSILDLVPDKLRDRARQRYNTIIRTGKSEVVTQKSKTIDGQDIWVRIQDRRVTYQGQYCVLAVLIDITDEMLAKEAQELSAKKERIEREKKEQLQNQLIEQEKQAALNALLIGVSHQFNTPFGNILTSATAATSLVENLEKGIEGKTLKQSDLVNCLSELKTAMAVIHKSIDKSSSLIKSVKNIVSHSKSEDQIDIELASFSEGIFELFKHSEVEKRIVAEVDIACDVVVHSSTNIWIQLLTVLCENTITHGFRDVGDGRIRLELEQKESLVELTYSDDGNGIPYEDQSHIFQAFYSSSMAKNKGLGLALAYSLVTQSLGGKISLTDSKFGQGSGFLIQLPSSLFSKKSHRKQRLE